MTNPIGVTLACFLTSTRVSCSTGLSYSTLDELKALILVRTLSITPEVDTFSTAAAFYRAIHAMFTLNIE